MLPRLAGLGLAVPFLLVLAACGAPIESTVALSEPGEPYDEHLVGVWYQADDDGSDAVMLTITAAAETPLLKIIALYARSDVTWLSATAFASRVGSEVYYNARRNAGVGLDYTAEGEQPGFSFWKIRFLNDTTIELCALDKWKEDDGGAPGVTVREVDARVPGADSEDRYRVLDAEREALLEAMSGLSFEDYSSCFEPFRKAEKVEDVPATK